MTQKMVFIPAIANITGLNEAVVLSQIHYWIEKNKEQGVNFHDGRTWVFQTYREWNEQFTFWGKNTIIRAIERLEERGFIISGNYNKYKYDKTKWYTIDYNKVDETLHQNGYTVDLFQVHADTQGGTMPDPDMGKPIQENNKKNNKESEDTHACNEGVLEDERMGYGEYGWVRLTEDEIISLIIDYGEEAADRAIIYIDTLAQQTGNRNGWHDWLLTCKRAIHENWGGIMNGLR